MSHKITKRTGVQRIFFATYNSYKALKHNIVHEAAFRQEVIAAVILIPVAFYIDVLYIERLLMVSSIVLILIVELLNTAIEAVVDRIGLEFHELSGLAKDSGSAAVLFSLLLMGFIWIHAIFL